MIGVVLLQPGKGADMGASFGGGQTIFGGRGPVSFLSKITWVMIAVLMVTSVTLSIITKRNAYESSVIDMTEEEIPSSKGMFSGASGPAQDNTSDVTAPANVEGDASAASEE